MNKTTKEFYEEVKQMTNGEYILIGDYINNKAKVKMLHTKCNNTILIRPDRFIQGDRCSYCYGNRRKTTKEFYEEVKQLTNGEYILKDEYINNSTKISILHTKCGNIWKISPVNFLNGHRCPYCFGSKKSNIEEFKNKVFEQVKNKYTVLSKEYINNKTKIKIKHNDCGYEYEVTPDMFLNKKRRCPKCALQKRSKNKTLTHEQFLNKINENDKKDFIFLSEYKGRKEYITIKHTKCNNIFKMKADEFLSGNRCPYCRESKGEQKIRKWLENNNYDYETQYKFSDCKYKRCLPFDFKLQDDSGKIILIEYDGEFHFSNIYYNKDLENQKIRDEIKNNYCKSHLNIDLYRINYKDYDNIESILESIIKKYE